MYLDVPVCTDYNYAGHGRRLFVFIWDAALPQVHSLTDGVVEDGVGSEAVINFPGKKMAEIIGGRRSEIALKVFENCNLMMLQVCLQDST